MSKPKDDELPIFVKWMEFLEWLLPTTAKFPQKVRHTFAQRIEKLALKIAENLIEARYTSGKVALLNRINLKLEKLRMLLRLSHRLQYLPHRGYEHAMRTINEVGEMLGGWRKEREGK